MRLGSGSCLLRANALRLDLTRRTLTGQQVELCADADPGEPGPTLWAHRLRLFGVGVDRLHAELVRGALCACDRSAPLLWFTARRARVDRSGRRLHLGWPVLRVGPVPVAALPYLALPLAPGVSGLLPPEVGYSGRDGLRLAQGAYLAGDGMDLLLSGGWIQGRGAQGRTRLRFYRRWLEVEIQGRGIRDGTWNRGQVRGRVVAHGVLGRSAPARGGASARGAHWAASVTPDLTSDPELPSVLEGRVERVFAPFLRSRAWIHGAWRSLYATGLGDLHQAIQSALVSGRGLGGATGLALGVAPTRLAGPLSLMLEGGIDHLAAGAGGGETLVRLDPELVAGGAVGPVRLSARGRYRIRGAQDDGARVIHAGLLSLQAALPLARDFGGWIHVLGPAAGVEWSMLDVDLEMPDGVTLKPAGVETEVGLRTELWIRDGLPRRVIDLWTGALLPAPGSGSPALVGSRADLAAGRLLRGELHALWAPGEGRLATLRGRLCAGPPGLRICGGYTRLRVQRAGELSGELFGAWLLEAGTLLPLLLAPDQVNGSVELRLGGVRAAGAVAWDPVRRQHSHSSLGVSTALGCGCYRVGVAGAARRGQRWPDVSLTLELVGAGALRCWP
jgi:hypothetical protein